MLLLLLSNFVITFHYFISLGEEFWDIYLRGFRPANYFDIELDLHTDKAEHVMSDDKSRSYTPKLRKDITKTLKLFRFQNSHWLAFATFAIFLCCPLGQQSKMAN